MPTIKKSNLEGMACFFVAVFSILLGLFMSFWQIKTDPKHLALDTLFKPHYFWKTFWSILMTNSKISLLIILLGCSFYVIATGVVGVNLIIFGSSIGLNSYKNGFSDTLIRYLHSLIEIPAIVFSLFISYRISTLMIQSLKDQPNVCWKATMKKLAKLIFFSLFLFVIAAAMESIMIHCFMKGTF